MNKKVVNLLLGVGVIGICIIITCISLALIPSPPVTSSVPTPASIGLNTSVPVDTADPTLTCQEIRENYESMTEFQFDSYSKSLIGKDIKFYGSVVEVYDGGDLQINGNCGGWVDVISLYGVDQNFLMNLSKDSKVQGRGTVRNVEKFISLVIDIDVTSIQK